MTTWKKRPSEKETAKTTMPEDTCMVELGVLLDEVIHRNSGKAFEVLRGQLVRIIGQTTVDFVAFNLHDLEEKFDQARTKTNESKIFLSKGDRLWSNRGNTMLIMVEDTFVNGHHDLQKSMCSRRRYEMVFLGNAKRLYDGKAALPSKFEDLPPHGCLENLSEVLKDWNMSPDAIPNPFNIFQHMRIDALTGLMYHTDIRPAVAAHVDLRAEMDCLIAVSGCIEGGVGRDSRVQVFRPQTAPPAPISDC